MFLSHFSFKPSLGSSQGLFRLWRCFNEWTRGFNQNSLSADCEAVVRGTHTSGKCALQYRAHVICTALHRESEKYIKWRKVSQERTPDTKQKEDYRRNHKGEKIEWEWKYPHFRQQYTVCNHRDVSVWVCVFARDRLTSTGPVRHQHVAVEAVALVTPICVHAPVFTRPRLQPTLIQVCRQREVA